ncbi:MAG: GTPase [Nanoarchaeota archaeon]|nr:GTPase [Nanoarchaeota archaeon]
MGFWPVTKKVIKDSDIILLILDVRMPLMSMNKELGRMIAYHKKVLVYVFNKIDITTSKYLNKIKDQYPDAFFVSGVKNIGISNLKRSLLIMAKRMKIDEPKIGIVGYPNVGKSAVINAIAKRARAKVSAKAGTTRGIQWIKAGGLMILDSPGVVPFDDSERMLGIMGAKNIEKIRNVERIAYEVMRMLIQYNKSIIEKFYDISVDGKDYDMILEEIARKKGYLLKGGIIDERRAALLIVKDWHEGKLRL